MKKLLLLFVSMFFFLSCDDDEPSENPDCKLTNLELVSEIQCEGDCAQFTLSFEVEGGSGSYAIINGMSEEILSVEENAVSTGSISRQLCIPTTSITNMMLSIRDESSSDCTSSTSLNIDLPDCSFQAGNPSDLEFITVEAGTFDMGCTDEQFNCYSDESPVHSVTLSSFQLSKYEITNFQYAEFLNAIGAESNGYYNGQEYMEIASSYCKIDYVGGSFVAESGRENHPVVEVNWYGAKAYCVWAGGRLPTEAEWEYAARGGNQSNGYIYSGGDDMDAVGWYNNNSGSDTHNVGEKAANELGFFDMSGNVWEWCNDWYDSSYYSLSPVNNPQGPENGSVRVVRGGSWGFNANGSRVASRYCDIPDFTLNGFGFRCAKDF